MNVGQNLAGRDFDTLLRVGFVMEYDGVEDARQRRPDDVRADAIEIDINANLATKLPGQLATTGVNRHHAFRAIERNCRHVENQVAETSGTFYGHIDTV